MNYQIQEQNNFPRAFAISSGILGGLLLLSFFIMIGSKLPQFGMGGMIVNYGTAEFGMGDDYMTVDEPSMDPNANALAPDMVDRNQTPEEVASQQSTDRTAVTQDMYDAPAVVTTEPTRANAAQTTVEREKSTPTVNPNALYTGRQNNATGRGDGTGTVAGNQGSELGDPLASNYGEGGSGFGDTPLNVANLRWVVPPKFDDNGQYAGIVAVEVTFAPDGRVTQVRAGVQGTTLPDKRAWDHVESAMRGARLNIADRGSTTAKAVIYVSFRLK